MVRTSRTQVFIKLRQEHPIYILTGEDIREYPVLPQNYVEVGKYRYHVENWLNTNTAFMISHAYLKCIHLVILFISSMCMLPFKFDFRFILI